MQGSEQALDVPVQYGEQLLDQVAYGHAGLDADTQFLNQSCVSWLHGTHEDAGGEAPHRGQD